MILETACLSCAFGKNKTHPSSPVNGKFAHSQKPLIHSPSQNRPEAHWDSQKSTHHKIFTAWWVGLARTQNTN